MIFCGRKITGGKSTELLPCPFCGMRPSVHETFGKASRLLPHGRVRAAEHMVGVSYHQVGGHRRRMEPAF